MESLAGYLGNRSNRIVHHLGNMKKECEIYQMKMQDREYFTPDTIENAKSKNFVECKFCMG
jgi:hypothetical protein